MAILSYERRPLLILRAADSTPEEILDFLNSHSQDGYTLEVDPTGELCARLRSNLDRSTTVGVLRSTVLLFDPEDSEGGIHFLQGDLALKRFGVDSARLSTLALEPEVAP